jgi:hypothetical protein
MQGDSHSRRSADGPRSLNGARSPPYWQFDPLGPEETQVDPLPGGARGRRTACCGMARRWDPRGMPGIPVRLPFACAYFALRLTAAAEDPGASIGDVNPKSQRC